MARFNFRFLSKSLLRNAEVNLIVPSLDLHGALAQENARYYEEDEERFPLVILLSGFGSDNEAWIQNTEIYELCDSCRIAAAFVGGENKWYLDHGPIDGWHTFLKDELPDFIYGNFSRIDASRPPVIGGVSMGGYGALYNALKSPESFSAVMALSPATKPDGWVDESKFGTLRELFLSARDRLPPVYISVGGDDFICGASRELDDWLKDNVPEVRYKFVSGHGHNWRLWRLEIEEFLQTLKNKKII